MFLNASGIAPGISPMGSQGPGALRLPGAPSHAAAPSESDARQLVSACLIRLPCVTK